MVQEIHEIRTIFRDNAKQAADRLRKVETVTKQMARGMRQVTTVTNAYGRTVQKTERTISGLTRRFEFHYLSILFFGMAIRRTFETMARSATQTYLKMTEGQTQAGQALLGLSASFSFLSFTVGEALGRFLEPFLPTIISIVNVVGDWISQNETLVGGLIAAGLAVGTFLMWTGILKLGLMGIQMWAEAAAGAKGIGMLSGALSGLTGPVGIAIGALALLAGALIISEWDEMTKAAKAFGDYISAGLRGDIGKAEENLELFKAHLKLAFEEFFTVKLPLIVKAAIEVITNLLNEWARAVSIAFYSFFLPPELAVPMGNVAGNINVPQIRIPEIPGLAERAKYIQSQKRLLAEYESTRGAGGSLAPPNNITINELNINGVSSLDEIIEEIRRRTNVTVG